MDLNRTLSPSEAALTAEAVYGIRNHVDIEKAFRSTRDIRQSFIKRETARVVANTGAFSFKSSSGFAVVAKGQGEFNGHALLACRGTQGRHDVLTDLNAGIQLTPTGYKVHAGFNRTFNSFREEIRRWIARHRPHVIHCVGHSLGGALANLCAIDIVSRANSPRVHLYTFGAPRTGDTGFADKLSMHPKVGIGGIHRVYHAGDPISMVPLWPFVHAPQPRGECYVGKVLGFNPFQHLMGGYLDSVKGHKDWATLRQPPPDFASHCLEWLLSSDAYMFGGLNFYNLAMVSQAISMLAKKTIALGLTPVNVTLVSGATILDYLSYMLDASAKVSEENSSLVSHILRKILILCGIKADNNISITRQFIRYVFTQLTLAVNRAASTALTLTNGIGL